MKVENSILTIGTVVDTNDPQQMGRLRVNCPKWGDTPDTLVIDIPWAAYVAPFGGILTRGTRGPENATTEGPVAYGMWAIPKVGATVVCMRLDEDPNHRMWMGSIHADHMAHTLPSGRYLDSGTVGPVSSTEQPIEPLSTNMNEAFGAPAGNYERLTRGAENQAASISNKIMDKVVSSRADDRNDNSRTGYQASRVAPPGLGFTETGGNFDPQTYSLTTPGMHSFVMDDSLKNGKIRIRSTSGNQVILDDTNERIYISTPEGNNWVEMDRNGNVDVYSSRRISFHAEQDINLTAGNTIRLSAKDIHLRTANQFRLDANGSIGIHGSKMVLETDGTFNLTSAADLFITSGNEIDIKASSNITVGSENGTLDLSAKSDIWVQSWDDNVNIKAIGGGGSSTGTSGVSGSVNPNASVYILAEYLNAGQIGFDATLIQTNNGLAIGQLASNATIPGSALLVGSDLLYAYTTNRTPQHEPWGRIMIRTSTSDSSNGAAQSDIVSVIAVPQSGAILDLSYTDYYVNRRDYTTDPKYSRNLNWRR